MHGTQVTLRPREARFLLWALENGSFEEATASWDHYTRTPGQFARTLDKIVSILEEWQDLHDGPSAHPQRFQQAGSTQTGMG